MLAAALGCALLGLFVLRPAPTPGPVLRDFEAYYAAGATAREDGDPYGREIWRVERSVPGVDAGRDELLPFVGPPFGLPAWMLFGSLPWPGAAAVWGGLLACAAASLALGALRLGAGPLRSSDVPAAFAFGAGFGPLTSGLALGQVAIVSCAAVAWMLLFLRGRRGALFGTLGSALVALLQPHLAPVLATRLGERRAALGIVGAIAVAAIGSALALGGPDRVPHYFAILARHAAAERALAIQVTPGAIARALGASPQWAAALAIAAAGAAILGVGLQCASRAYGAVARVALACAALPLALPFAHEHDLTLAFLPALLCVRSGTGRRWHLAACAALAAGVDWLGLAQRPDGIAQTAVLTLGAGFALAVLSREPVTPARAVPAIAAACAVLALGAIAAHHPVTVWPNALPLDFHAPRGAGAAEVWRLEQIASGVARLQPWSGVLRACSLAGCAALWLAAALILRRNPTELESQPRSEPSSTARRRPAATYPSA